LGSSRNTVSQHAAPPTSATQKVCALPAALKTRDNALAAPMQMGKSSSPMTNFTHLGMRNCLAKDVEDAKENMQGRRIKRWNCPRCEQSRRAERCKAKRWVFCRPLVRGQSGRSATTSTFGISVIAKSDFHFER
jgi:hypothetical protein